MRRILNSSDRDLKFDDKDLNFNGKDLNFDGKNLNFNDKDLTSNGKNLNFHDKDLNIDDKNLNSNSKDLSFDDEDLNFIDNDLICNGKDLNFNEKNLNFSGQNLNCNDKDLNPCSVEMLHTLCNQIYYSKDCPKDWGKAIIVPLHKKGDRAVCSNYRAISLLSVPGKVYTKVLQQRWKRDVEESMSEEQAGFRKGRGTTDQIFVIMQLSEKHIKQNRTLYNNLIDYKQAFDSVWQVGLWRVMRYCGVPEELVTLIEDLYSKSAVRIEGELTEWFRIKVGVRQGCGLSPDLFNLILEIVMRFAEKEGSGTEVKLNGKLLDNLRFAM